MEKLKFGDRILITNKLVRKQKQGTYQRTGYPRNVTLKVWDQQPLMKLTEVLVIGKRTLWNGEKWWEEEAGYQFNPKEKVSAYLVAEKMSRKPYYVSAASL